VQKHIFEQCQPEYVVQCSVCKDVFKHDKAMVVHYRREHANGEHVEVQDIPVVWVPADDD
jgi:hypothetical protein